MTESTERIPVTGYLHVALMHGPAGLMVAAEMHGRIMQSGMYSRVDRIKVCVVGDATQLLPLCELLSPYGKYTVESFSEDLTLWEWPTLGLTKKDCDGGLQGHVWYMHTKGASQAGRLKSPRTTHIYKNVAAWRGAMFKRMIVIDRVPEGYGAAGPFLRATHSSGRHFSGNFWWATSDYVRSLEAATDEMKKERGTAETWIGTAPGELFSTTLGWDESTELYGFGGSFPLGIPTA